MVVTETEFLLVDPDRKKLGWGVVHFICFLQVRLRLMMLLSYNMTPPLSPPPPKQDVDVTSDPADSCSLYVVCSRDSAQKRPALSARFQFDDHIRCASARQLLLRSKDNLRLAKMTRITKMLHLPVPEASPTSSVAALPRAQTDAQHNLGVISVSPTPRTLDRSSSGTDCPVELTSSMLNNVFLPPSATPHNPQEFEMSNFRLNRHSQLQHSLAEADAPIIFDSPVKLAPPISPPTEEYSSESSNHSCRDSLDASLTNVHIGTDSLFVHYDNSAKCRTPETLLEQSFGSHTEEQLSELSTSTEQLPTPSCPAEGYRVEYLGEGEVGNRGDTPSGSDSSTAEEDRVMCLKAEDQLSCDTGDNREYDRSGHVQSDLDHDVRTNSNPEQMVHPLAKEEYTPRQLLVVATNRENSTRRLGSAPGQLRLRTGGEDAPGHLQSSSTLSNGMLPTSTVNIGEGDAPTSLQRLPVLPRGVDPPATVHEWAVSSNIIWDVPLIDELNTEEHSRTVPSPHSRSPQRLHRSHD